MDTEALIQLVMRARWEGYADARKPLNDTVNRCRQVSEAMVKKALLGPVGPIPALPSHNHAEGTICGETCPLRGRP